MRDATTADTRALEARLSTCPVTYSKKYVNPIDMSGTGPHSRKTQPKKSSGAFLYRLIRIAAGTRKLSIIDEQERHI
ncbi:hypothetical protein GCM10007968_19130 [Sporolactobacillus putidus]|uniref:Uncharacterized protein n=1 Tax=Sporolactobacillus putidus TaxID=492735 RepID=A0A917S3M3_9BACL|nr:hypothetical protein GCM10007968_19130 [Sporolactobacillus putidus]